MQNYIKKSVEQLLDWIVNKWFHKKYPPKCANSLRFVGSNDLGCYRCLFQFLILTLSNAIYAHFLSSNCLVLFQLLELFSLSLIFYIPSSISISVCCMLYAFLYLFLMFCYSNINSNWKHKLFCDRN